MGLEAWKKRRILAALTELQDNLCALCGLPFTEERPATIDHIVPISTRSVGVHRRENLQAAHESCNGIRSSLPLDEFRALVASGHIVLPDEQGRIPSYRERRLRRKYGASYPPVETRSEERRYRARLVAALMLTAPVARQGVWRGEGRSETRQQRNDRLRSETDAMLREE